MSQSKATSRKRLSAEDYTIGCIAFSVPEELIERFLDEIHPPLPAQSDDYNAYTFGRIGPHNVVFMIPSSTARDAASSMALTFRHLQLTLVVSLAGGAPLPDRDIRLGDVVMTMPIGSSPGLLQGAFDYTKGFRATDVPVRISREVSLALHKIQSRLVLQPGLLQQTLDKKILQGRFRHPGPRRDMLYEADYLHKFPDGWDASECALCNPQRIVRDRIKRDNPWQTVVHHGTIGTGYEVPRYGVVRDLWSKEKGILCFETQTPGLVSLNGLLICGISNYADSHQNDMWQDYAAAVALAYAKDLLQILPPFTAMETPQRQEQSGKLFVLSLDALQMVVLRQFANLLGAGRSQLESAGIATFENKYTQQGRADFEM